jgi:energy-coupling factor transport system permease protein
VRASIAYAHRPGPLGDGGALAASAFLGSLAVAALVASSPLMIAAAGAGVAICGLASGAGRALGLAARWSAGLGLLLVLVNGIASQRGDTVIVNGIHPPPFGTFDVTAEALAAGAVQALRLGVVISAFAVHAATVNPDRVLRLLRPIASRSALTATLIARLVPVAVADYVRLAEAVALRGPAAAPAGRAALVRRLVAGSLDRAIDVAATLELRGYGSGAPRSARGAPRSRHDAGLWVAGAALLGVAIAAEAAGFASFDAYPRLSVAAGPAALAAAAAIPALASVPFLADRWSVRRG